eukprot:4903391-Lingulodinium_polyedra.AAC.1
MTRLLRLPSRLGGISWLKPTRSLICLLMSPRTLVASPANVASMMRPLGVQVPLGLEPFGGASISLQITSYTPAT